MELGANKREQLELGKTVATKFRSLIESLDLYFS